MLTAKLILERFSKDGRLLERRERPSRSFLFQFIELLYVAHAQIQSGAPYAMTDIDSVARDIDVQSASDEESKCNLKIGSLGGDGAVYVYDGYYSIASQPSRNMLEGSKIGIQVGTGVGAVIPADVALGTRIAHGSAGGQLEYGGCELLSMAFVDPDGEFTIRRYFTNNSGGGITVEEVGIYAAAAEYFAGAAGGSWPFCIARDLTGGVAVANTELLRATYVLQITV
ncbi:hypothetical protein ES708_05917 [subsurface metagenome]